MNRIPTFVINLKSSSDRKRYMESVLSPYQFLDVKYIEAVDGRTMPAREQENLFDQNEAYRKYGRVLRCGEIGCTLSHIRCAQEIMKMQTEYALVLEDDLVIRNGDRLESVLDSLVKSMSPAPQVMLLTGDYWYVRLNGIADDLKVADVWEAVCSGAYLINRAAAGIMSQISPCHLADDWRTIMKAGIAIRAVSPHIADQNRLDLKTEMTDRYPGKLHRNNMPFVRAVGSMAVSGVSRFLKYIGHFENKDFVW